MSLARVRKKSTEVSILSTPTVGTYKHTTCHHAAWIHFLLIDTSTVSPSNVITDLLVRYICTVRKVLPRHAQLGTLLWRRGFVHSIHSAKIAFSYRSCRQGLVITVQVQYNCSFARSSGMLRRSIRWMENKRSVYYSKGVIRM